MIDRLFRPGVSIEAFLRMRWYCFYVMRALRVVESLLLLL
jgi:hypothetical protein